ncbi:ATPase [Brumimicrobium salinarum]|uniref:ATPase n=1 Tax=Brumimicrobium salinarum TaxID=2058658 RepID=A0A2I0R295_9FLAO|nr:ATPase [Brumimicrobium salinarum]PKR80701.1 ATPase [Brumimicrobium salinarum]
MKKPYTVKNKMRHFKFHDTLHFLQNVGKEKYGQEFRFHNEDIKILHKLIIYMIHEDIQCKKYGIDLNKGVLLTGPVGCGKTSWMNIIQVLLFQNQTFQVKSTRDIAFEFNQEGFSTVLKYGNRNKTLCLDDIGVEQNIKFYGNECNTIAEILLKRYDLLINHQVITHATTNLTANEIENIYGNRVRSRLRKMFNLISFPASTKDKRK